MPCDFVTTAAQAANHFAVEEFADQFAFRSRLRVRGRADFGVRLGDAQLAALEATVISLRPKRRQLRVGQRAQQSEARLPSNAALAGLAAKVES